MFTKAKTNNNNISIWLIYEEQIIIDILLFILVHKHLLKDN